MSEQENNEAKEERRLLAINGNETKVAARREPTQSHRLLVVVKFKLGLTNRYLLVAFWLELGGESAWCSKAFEVLECVRAVPTR